MPRQQSNLPWSIRERNLIDPNCLYTSLRSQTAKLTNPGAVIGTCCNDRLAQLKWSRAKHPTERCPQYQLSTFDFCRHQRNSESERNGNVHDLSASPLELLSLVNLVQTSRKCPYPPDEICCNRPQKCCTAECRSLALNRRPKHGKARQVLGEDRSWQPTVGAAFMTHYVISP